MQLSDDTRDEERIGLRDLTRWPSRLGRGLVWLAVELAKRVSAHAVLFITAAIGCALVIALTAAGAEIYDSVEDGEGLAGIDRPVLDGALGLRSETADRLVTWFTNLGGRSG